MKKKRRNKSKIYCDPGLCDNCIYIGEGDSICDLIQEIVLDDWMPTTEYMGEHCPHNPANKRNRPRTLGNGANGL